MAAQARGEFVVLTLPLGPCECPGDPKPHPDGDSCRYKDRLEYGDWRRVNAAPGEERGAVLFLRALVGWNLVDENGEPTPLDLEHLDTLSLRQSGILVGTIDTPKYVLGDIMKDFADPNPLAGAGDSPVPAETTIEPLASGPEA